MDEFITQSEIELLTKEELLMRHSEIFNALARNRHAVQNCAQLIETLQKIETALARRQLRRPG